jgi:hypothetical protein
MSEPVDAKYVSAVAEAVARRGTGVSINESIYGWQDFETVWHIKGRSTDSDGKSFYDPEIACHWVAPENPKVEEDIVDEFADTFAGNNETAVINLFHASCACGKYTDRTVRYAGSLGEFIPELFWEDDAEDPVGEFDYPEDYNPYD